MGALNFTELLGGFTKGATDRYSKIQDQNREDKLKNDNLIASSLTDAMKDPNLLPEEHDQLFREVLKRRGVDNATIEGLSKAAGHYRQIIDEKNRSSAKPATFTPGSTNEDGITSPDVTLPALPQQPRRTMGDIGLENDTKKAEMIQGANRQAAREGIAGQLQDHLDLVEKYKDNPEALKYLNALPTTAGSNGASTYAPKTIAGKDLKAVLAQQNGGVDRGDIQDDQSYTVSMGPDKVQIKQYLPVQAESKYGSKTLGANIQSWTNVDAFGNPIDPNTIYTVTRNMLNGNPTKAYPETFINSVSTGQNIQVVTQANGDQTLVVTPTTSTNTKTTGPGVPGALGAVPSPATGGIPPVPSMPVGGSQTLKPQGASQTLQTPQTVIEPPPTNSKGEQIDAKTAKLPPSQGGAMPASYTSAPSPTPLDKPLPASSGSNGRVIGVKPLSQGENADYNKALTGIERMDRALQMIKDDPNVLLKSKIPLLGAIIAPTFKRETGAIADLVSRINSGAVLNENELKFYNKQLPGAADVLSEYLNFDKDAVINALQLHRQFFQRVVDVYQHRRPDSTGPVPKPTPGQPLPKGGAKKSIPDDVKMKLDGIFNPPSK